LSQAFSHITGIEGKNDYNHLLYLTVIQFLLKADERNEIKGHLQALGLENPTIQNIAFDPLYGNGIER